MNLDSFTGAGSTPSRRRFWDKVTQAVIASQKVSGRFVTVDEHPGKGSVINVDRKIGSVTTGACCGTGDWPSNTCSIQTEADCLSSMGNYLGDGTPCEGLDCNSGACCVGTGLTLGDCVDEADFLCVSPSIFHGYGTACADIRCEGSCAVCKFCLGPINSCDCGFGAYDCHYSCFDNLTFDECSANTGSTEWVLAGSCGSLNPCEVFSGGCAVGGTGACCLGGFCVDDFTHADCDSAGGIWYVDCTCFDCAPECC